MPVTSFHKCKLDVCFCEALMQFLCLMLCIVQMFIIILCLFCQALQDKVHSKIFRTKRPKAYVNGISDRTQKKLAFYFKPLPKSLPSPRQHHTTAHTVQLYGSCAQKVYQDVDNEVCIVYYWLNSINDLLGSSNELPFGSLDRECHKTGIVQGKQFLRIVCTYQRDHWMTHHGN